MIGWIKRNFLKSHNRKPKKEELVLDQTAFYDGEFDKMMEELNALAEIKRKAK